MPTLLIAVTFVISIAVVSFVLAFLNRQRRKRRTDKMLRRFSELGTEYNLSFTGQEVLGRRIIGVDGLKGKVLFLEEEDEAHPVWSMIDLTEAKSCRVMKTYGGLSAKSLSQQDAEAPLHSIALEFALKKNDGTVALPFYKHVSNSMQEANRLEAKAKNWETLFSKMLTKEKGRA